MRRWAIVLLLTGLAWPAMAAKSVTVGQLEQLLDTLRGKSDGKVAQELSDLELTERVNLTRLAHWEAEFPGSKSHEALTKLADLAAFLSPPAAVVVPIAAPDSATQERMLDLAAEYIRTAITRLPNFIATRETTHFEDTPATEKVIMRGPAVFVGNQGYKSLHSTGSSSTAVTYRDGKEVQDAHMGKGKLEDKSATWLTTSGEFGPILAVVMSDALRGTVAWQRWEEGAPDPVAVFHYAVPAEQSNYMVGIPLEGTIKQIYPGYHGEIAIDPATGAILRMSVMAELPPPYEAMQVAILVEYAPVMIGELSYICPVHGVALSKVPVVRGSQVPVGPAVEEQTQLNDVVFTQYHVFRSEARIVSTGSGDGGAGTAPAEHQP